MNMDRSAFSGSKNRRSGLSAAEFQRNLYTWFVNRGLMDESRAHLRQQMVTALRDTSLRPSPSRCLKSNVTPKIQAINLLVAEFLLQQRHHFSLSVFTSEVPLLRSMPEFTLSGTQVSSGSNTAGESMPRFQHQDVKDIMEILGLSLDTEVGYRIYCQYQDNSENTALLTSILQNSPIVLGDRSHTGENNMSLGPTQDRKSNKKFKDDAESSNKESSSAKKLAEVYNAEMQEVLYQSHLKSLHIKQLQEELRRFQDCEVERIRKEEEAKYKKELKELTERESRIQADICRREEEITQKLNDAEDRLARQRQSLDDDLQIKQKELSELTTQLQEQRLEAAHKLRQVEEHAEELKHQKRMMEETKQKEALLLVERTSELDVRQEQLHQEFDRLIAQRETMSNMQRELEENRLQLVEASQLQASFVRDLQQQCAHLRLELDAARLKLNSLTELQSQKPSHSKVSRHHRSVEKVDKGLQTALPLPADDLATAIPERLPAKDRALEPEGAQSQLEEHRYLTNLLHQVQLENQDLRGHTQQQRLRIDELTSHAVQLASQLEDAHAAITLLSNRLTPDLGPLDPPFLHPGPGTITVPPLTTPPPPPPPLLPPHSPGHALRVMNSHQMGAGEELSYVTSPLASQPTAPSVPVTSRHSSLHHRREFRKKPPRRIMVYGNTTSSDETSPTEEIIQEARRRLHRLEEESEAVDRSYRDFQMRHSESVARTASGLFHPIMGSTQFQQQSNNLGYRRFTTSQPIYSSAMGGGQNIQIPFISRNTNYDDVPVLTQPTGTSFNPAFSHNIPTFISPLFQTERIPPFQYANRSQNQFAFPQRPETQGTVDNTATNISDRITTQPQSREFTALSTAVPQTDSQPSTSTDIQSRGVHQRKDKADPISSWGVRRSSLSHTKLLDTCSSVSVDPHLHNQHQAKNVSFGSCLKTVTIYNSSQVSSLTMNAANQNISQKELHDGATRTVCFKSAEHPAASKKTSKIASTRSLANTQGLSRKSDSWGEDLITKETDKLASCVADSSTSSMQGDDGISLQFQRRNSCRDMHDYNGKNNVTNRLSDDNTWKSQHKSSSYGSPSLEPQFILKGTKSSDKNITGKTYLNEIPVSDVSKSHTSVPGALYSSHESESIVSSRTTVTTERSSNETDLQQMLSVSDVSSTTVPSDKDTGFKDKSNNEESPTPAMDFSNEKISNKHIFNSSVGIIPIQEENVVSEISGSGTQMTAQNKEIKTINNKNTVMSSSQDIREKVAEDIDIDKGDKQVPEQVLVGVESRGISQSSLIVPEEMDESRHITRTNYQEDTQDLVEEKQTNFEGKELSKYVTERSQSHDDFANASEESDKDKNQRFTSFLKAPRDDTAEPVADDSDQAISVGEDSKREDLSKHDFW